MMYQIMVIEDDLFFRTNFINIVCWEDLNCYIAETAENGEDALKKLEHLPIDIIITDIEMPFLNGVQLIQFIQTTYPHIRSVILSNFDSFLYVKEGMKYGASDYLLKHQLTEDKVKTVIKNLLLDLEVSKSLKCSHDSNGDALNYIKPMVIQNYLQSLLSGTLQSDFGLDYFKELFPHFPIAHFIIAVFKIDNYHQLISSHTTESMTKYLRTFRNICDQSIEKIEQGLLVSMEENTFCLLFSSHNTSSSLYLTSQLNMVIQNLKTTIKRFFNVTCSFGISDICIHLSDLPRFYDSALNRVNQTFFVGNDSVVRTPPPNQKAGSMITLDYETEKKIYVTVSAGDSEQVHHLLTQLFEQIKEHAYSKDALQSLAMELVNLSIRICKNKQIELDFLYPNLINPRHEILQYSNYETLLQYLIHKFDKITSLAVAYPAYHALTRQSLFIIKTQFSKDLSLSQVAETLGTNSSYLSRIFKQDLSIGFAEYLTTIRIAEVQNLILNQDMDIKTAAAKCGFFNYNYFFKVFKEKCNVTPQEYKNNHII